MNVNAYDSESRNSGDAEGQARVRIPMEQLCPKDVKRYGYGYFYHRTLTEVARVGTGSILLFSEEDHVWFSAV